MELNKIHNMDCIEGMKLLPDNSIDSIVTDPPYEIGFMGKGRDSTGIANNVDMRKECLRVLKPGGYLLSFGATRTYHRMACAIEDAGFEVRDMIEWVYSTGFPKSLNIGKAVDKRGGTTSDQSKEFAEYIKNRRTELNITLSKADEVICDGTTNYSWFEGRPAGQRLPRKADYLKMKELLKLDDRYDSFMEETEREVVGKDKKAELKEHVFFGDINKAQETGKAIGYGEWDITKGTSEWEGWGTALKPAHEPICMARKPLTEKTVAENCLKWGTGGINIDGSRVGTDNIKINNTELNTRFANFNTQDTIGQGYISKESIGRFPANLIHDNSEEVRECFPESSSTNRKNIAIRKDDSTSYGGKSGQQFTRNEFGDSGNASRFFKSIIYQAKASKSERNKGCEEIDAQIRVRQGLAGEKKDTLSSNFHPTVKPTALMEYLIKMVTKEGGTVLDPFTGSGTTLVAATKNHYKYIGFELNKDYCEIAEKRIEGMKGELGLFSD